jgi:hypothetical protein
MIIVLLVISAIAKILQDLCKVNAFPKSWTWWNERTSWTYKDDFENWIFNRQIDWIEWLFNTVLVWITDGWHFWQMIFLNSLFVAGGIAAGVKWYWVILVIIVYKIIFELGYSSMRKILNRKTSGL